MRALRPESGAVSGGAAGVIAPGRSSEFGPDFGRRDAGALQKLRPDSGAQARMKSGKFSLVRF